MNRYEMEPILNPAGRFVIYGDAMHTIEKLEAQVAELEAQTPSALKAKLESAEARIAELEAALESSPCKCRWSYDHAASVLIKCPRCKALNK